MLGEAEIQDMIDQDNGAEATCHFCGQVYQADRQQLGSLITELRTELQSEV